MPSCITLPLIPYPLNCARYPSLPQPTHTSTTPYPLDSHLQHGSILERKSAYFQSTALARETPDSGLFSKPSVQGSGATMWPIYSWIAARLSSREEAKEGLVATAIVSMDIGMKGTKEYERVRKGVTYCAAEELKAINNSRAELGGHTAPGPSVVIAGCAVLDAVHLPLRLRLRVRFTQVDGGLDMGSGRMA